MPLTIRLGLVRHDLVDVFVDFVHHLEHEDHHEVCDRRAGEHMSLVVTNLDIEVVEIILENYDEVLRRFAEDNDINLLDERSKYIIRRVGSVPRQSRPFVEAMSQPMTEDSTVNFDGGAAEPLPEGVGESPYKRRREEPRLNIKNLRPWDKGILLQELVADRDEREAQRRGTSGRKRGAETPLDEDEAHRHPRDYIRPAKVLKK